MNECKRGFVVKIILIPIRPSTQSFNVPICNQEKRKNKLTQANQNRLLVVAID